MAKKSIFEGCTGADITHVIYKRLKILKLFLLDLEFIGGLRQSADLRKQNFIPAQVVKS